MPKKPLYHYVPTTGVGADFKRLMNEFISAKTVRYEQFCEIWRKRKFSLMCLGRHSEREVREFLERTFLIAVEYFLPPYQFQVRVGGLYLLYGIFMTQPLVPKVKVRLTISQWEDTILFQQEASQQNHLDVVYIFNKMVYEHAFQFCFTPSEMNERTVHLEKEDNELNLADEMKEERREINRLFNYESTEQLSYLLDHYHQMKVSMAGPKATRPDKSLDVVHGSMVEGLVTLLQSFKDSVSNIYKHGSAKDPTKEVKTSTPPENILSRRQKIKAKIFSEIDEETVNFEAKGSPVKAQRAHQLPSTSTQSKVEDAASEKDLEENPLLPPVKQLKKRGRPKKTIVEKDHPKTVKNGKNLPLSPSKKSKSLPVGANSKSGTPVDIEYVDSVHMHSQKGGELVSKLEEIATFSAKSGAKQKGKRGRKRKVSVSPKKNDKRDQSLELSDSDSVIIADEMKREVGSSKAVKKFPVPSTSNKKSLRPNEASPSKIIRVNIVSKKGQAIQLKYVGGGDKGKERNNATMGNAERKTDSPVTKMKTAALDYTSTSSISEDESSRIRLIETYKSPGSKGSGIRMRKLKKTGDKLVSDENEAQLKNKNKLIVSSKHLQGKKRLGQEETPILIDCSPDEKSIFRKAKQRGRRCQNKSSDESLSPEETTKRTLNKNVKSRKLTKKNEGVKTPGKVGGKKRKLSTQECDSFDERISIEENGSPSKSNKSKSTGRPVGSFKDVFKSNNFKDFSPFSSNSKTSRKSAGNLNDKSQLSVPPAPHVKVIEGIAFDKMQKPVKVIKIVKGSAEAKEVLNALDKKKTIGKQTVTPNSKTGPPSETGKKESPFQYYCSM